MKRSFQILIIVFSNIVCLISSFAQKPAGPCCTIMKIDGNAGNIIGRNNVTGQTFQFKASTQDLVNFKEGDNISMPSTNKTIVAINGEGRSYFVIDPTSIAPCCTIMSIAADPIAPCCNIIMAQNASEGYKFNFSVPKNISNGLQIGQPVSIGPIDGFAFVELNPGLGGNTSIFSYPIKNNTTLTQKNPAAPCCTVLFINTANNLVLLRDNTTGRLLQFKADASAVRNLRKSEVVSLNMLDNNRASVIDGGTTTVNIGEPDPVTPCCGSLSRSANPATPCCTIASISADPAAPCCSIVSTSDMTGSGFSFSVPNEITNHLKIGQGVFLVNSSMQSAGTKPIGPIDGFAIIQTSLGALQGYNTATYSYPVNGQSMSTNNGENDDDPNKKWVIRNDESLKGVMGRVVVNYPADADWVIDIYSEPGDKFLKSFYSSEGKHDFSYALMPGLYTIHLNHVPVMNVPIEKTRDTELKFGLLNIVTKSDWSLYDPDGKSNFRNGYNEAKKLPLPIGNYKLTLGGADVPVEIKNGKTVEY